VAKVRLGVALVVPAPVGHEIDGLRRALGEPFVERVPPHLTLVPPVNVRLDAVAAAVAVLRRAATTVRSLELTLGPVTDFLPDNPTLYLAVGGEPAELAALARLRDAVFQPPLERHLTWPFVPHVTVHDDHPAEAIAGAEAALAGYRRTVTFDALHLLEERRHGDAHRRWVPVAEARFGPARVIGRGGLELDLHISGLVDPEAAAFLDEHRAPTSTSTSTSPPGPALDATADPTRPDRHAPLVPAGCAPIVVAGRREGAVVGVARGWSGAGTTELVDVVVQPAARRQGIGRHLTAALHDAGSGPG
jgi:2'-5' RNA ligase